MRDVARAAAVSITTVSRVINGDPYVAEETSLRVRQAIEQLDYRINPLARSLRTGSDEAVGLVVETIGDPFFSSVIDAVEEAARTAGLFLLIASAGENAEQERAVVTGLLNRSVAGLLIVPCHLGYRTERLPIGPDGVPVVFIDRPSPGIEADTVMIDNAANARMATEHLIAHRHRRIGFAGTEVSRYPVSERLTGFRAALEAHGLAFSPGDVVDLHHRGHETDTHLLDAVLAPPDPVTAIITANATASQAVVREMHRIGRTRRRGRQLRRLPDGRRAGPRRSPSPCRTPWRWARAHSNCCSAASAATTDHRTGSSCPPRSSNEAPASCPPPTTLSQPPQEHEHVPHPNRYRPPAWMRSPDLTAPSRSSRWTSATRCAAC